MVTPEHIRMLYDLWEILFSDNDLNIFKNIKEEWYSSL